MRDVMKGSASSTPEGVANAQRTSTPQQPVNSNNISSKPPRRKPSAITQWVDRHKVSASIIAILFVAGIVGGILWLNARNDDQRVPASEVAAEYQKRLPELEDAVKSSPKDASVRKNYAVALYATGNFEKAKQQYEAAVKINDKDSTAYNNLGNVYRDLKNTDKAIEAYKKSIELNSKSINTYVNLANVQLYTLNKSDDAIATYKSGLKALPNNEQLELLLGIAYEQSGDIARAKQTYQNILSRNGENVAAKANIERLNK